MQTDEPGDDLPATDTDSPRLPDDAPDPDAEPNLRIPSDEAVAQHYDLAYFASDRPFDVPNLFHTLLRQDGFNPAAETAQWARAALEYHLRRRTHAGREQVELQHGLGPYDPALAIAQNPGDLAAWTWAAEKVRHPAGRALLFDLSIPPTGSGRLTGAARAMNAYLVAVTTPSLTYSVGDGPEIKRVWQETHRMHMLGRALTLIAVGRNSTDGPDTVRRIVAIAVDEAAQALRSPSPRIGHAALLLGVLAGQWRFLSTAEREHLTLLLDEAMGLWQDTVPSFDRIAGLIESVAPDRIPELRRRRVEVRLAAATEHTGNPAVAMQFLDEAARLARSYGLTDLTAAAVRRMQDTGKLDHHFTSVTTPLNIPRAVIDAEILRASDGTTWSEALTSWMNTPAPSGRRIDNERTHQNAAVFAPLQQSLPVTLLGPDHLPRWTPATTADRAEYDLSRVEHTHLQISGRVLAMALDQIVDRYGLPLIDELTSFLTHHGRGDALLAAALARGLHRYWTGDYEGCLHTVAVRVESGARAVVLHLDEPAYITARGLETGKYVSLDRLIDILVEHGLDEDWNRFLRTFLLGKTGLNVRNDVAHGFVLTASPRDAAALALRACTLFVTMAAPGSPLASSTTMASVSSPAWTVTDALTNVIRMAMHRPQRIPALLGAEVAAARSVVSATWRRASSSVGRRIRG